MEYSKDNPFKVITLCSGYDSQCMALSMLGELHQGFEYELVAWSEIDKYAIAAHNAVFPQWADRNLGDMTKIDWSVINEDIDLLTYSTPCQDISSAGKQRGVEEGAGTRSSILWYTRYAIQQLKPKFLMLENVKALTQQKFAPSLEKWCDELESYGYVQVEGDLYKKGEYGYDAEHPNKRKRFKVYNAKNFGVPQNRERVFVLSVRKDVWDAMTIKPMAIEDFPLDKCLADVLEENVDESFYLSDERIKGLMASTDAEKLAGRGYKFVPKMPDDIASSLTTLCGGGQKDR